MEGRLFKDENITAAHFRHLSSLDFTSPQLLQQDLQVRWTSFHATVFTACQNSVISQVLWYNDEFHPHCFDLIKFLMNFKEFIHAECEGTISQRSPTWICSFVPSLNPTVQMCCSGDQLEQAFGGNTTHVATPATAILDCFHFSFSPACPVEETQSLPPAVAFVPVQIYRVLPDATCTISHKGSRAGWPAFAVRGFDARPTAQRLFGLLPADLVIAAFVCGCSNKLQVTLTSAERGSRRRSGCCLTGQLQREARGRCWSDAADSIQTSCSLTFRHCLCLFLPGGSLHSIYTYLPMVYAFLRR